MANEDEKSYEDGAKIALQVYEGVKLTLEEFAKHVPDLVDGARKPRKPGQRQIIANIRSKSTPTRFFAS